MEEKKKSRPTWAQIRALESRVKELEDKARDVRSLEDRIIGLMKENELLKADVETYKEGASRWSMRVIELESRGFWARLLNKGV